MSNRMYMTPVPNFSKLDLLTKEDFLNLAITQTTSIRDRTQKNNKDIRDHSFEKYNAAYANKKGVSRSAVNLTGISAGSRMLNTAKHFGQKSTKNYGIIYFTDAKKEEIAYKHQHGIGVPKREFFGASPKDEKKLEKLAEDMLGKHIKEWERK